MKNRVIITIPCEIEWEGDPEYVRDLIDCLDHVVLKALAPGADRPDSIKAKVKKQRVRFVRTDPYADSK
jgi:hypothetical protein